MQICRLSNNPQSQKGIEEMPKSELISSVEKISERIARKVLKDCKFFGTMGTWIKTLQDENRTLKRRVEELEIRVKKLNDYGPTPVAGARKRVATGEAQSSSEAAMKTPPRLTRAQMKKIRADRGLSQTQFAQLLGVSYFRYNKWELGKTAVPPDTERLIREIREMKASDLRTHMQNAGIFQPNGKTAPSAAKTSSGAVPEHPVRNETEKNGVTEKPSETASRTSRRKETCSKAAISSEEVKSIRSALGMTQYEIAAKLKIKETRYKNWEQGRVKTPSAFIKKIRALLPTAAPRKTAEAPASDAAASRTAAKSAAIQPKELQALREELGLSRREMANALNIKKNRYCNWEYGIAHAAPQFVRKMHQMLETKKKDAPSPVREKKQADADRKTETPRFDFSDILNPDKVPSELPPARLKEIRAFLKLTQRQVAARLDIKENRYTNWECGYGKASPDYVHRVLALLSENLRKNAELHDGKSENPSTGIAAEADAVLSAKENRRIRAELGMSQKQVAEALGIKESRYKNWEYGTTKTPVEFSKMILALRMPERTKVVLQQSEVEK